MLCELEMPQAALRLATPAPAALLERESHWDEPALLPAGPEPAGRGWWTVALAAALVLAGILLGHRYLWRATVDHQIVTLRPSSTSSPHLLPSTQPAGSPSPQGSPAG